MMFMRTFAALGAIAIVVAGYASDSVSDCKNPTGQLTWCCGFSFCLAQQTVDGWVCPSIDQHCYEVPAHNDLPLAQVVGQSVLCGTWRACEPEDPNAPVHPIDNPCVKGGFNDFYTVTYRAIGPCE